MRSKISTDLVTHGRAVLLAGLMVLLFAPPASAGRPTAGGHYLGFPAPVQASPNLVDMTATLHVSRSGRRLTSARVQLGCKRPGGDAYPLVRLSFRGNPGARIRRDGSFRVSALGSFRVSARAVRGRVRVQGRFVTSQFARLFYRADVPPRRLTGGGRIVCEEAGSPAVVYRSGVPPFNSCASQRAKTLAASDSGRVLEQELLEGNEFFPNVYACLFASPSKRLHLGRNWDDARMSTFRLAGPYVAFFYGGCANCTWDQWSVQVRDVRDGGVVSRPNVRSYTHLSDLALKPNGSLAWTLERLALGPDGYPIGYPTRPPVSEGRDVWALDSRGQHLLDSGPDIDLESLELDDSTLTWTNDGTTRSASLD